MLSSIIHHLPILPVIILLFIAYILSVFANRRHKLVEISVVAALITALIVAICMSVSVIRLNGDPVIYSAGGWQAPWGIELSVGGLAALALLMISFVGLSIALYASSDIEQHMSGRKRTAWFFTLYLLLCAALAGLAVTNDIFNVYVFVEVATISSCALVSVKGSAASIKASFKYLVMATLASCFVLLGIGLIYILTGNLNMTFANAELGKIWTEYPHVLWMTVSLFLIGFGLKSALFPLHVWLPDAHSSTLTPASAVLSGLAVKGYIIAVAKIFYIVIGPDILQALGISQVLKCLGMASIIAGGIFAIAQDDLKRRLAYSTVSQIGYIFYGFGLFNMGGFTGALFYMASHAVIKAGLFLSAGSVVDRTGRKKISSMSGTGRQFPLPMAVFTVNSLALIGLPLLSGFVGKWTLLSASLKAGEWLGITVLIAGSLMCAAYLLPVIRLAYFGYPHTMVVRKTPVLHSVALIAMVIVVLIMGTYPEPFLRLASYAAKDLLGI